MGFSGTLFCPVKSIIRGLVLLIVALQRSISSLTSVIDCKLVFHLFVEVKKLLLEFVDWKLLVVFWKVLFVVNSISIL